MNTTITSYLHTAWLELSGSRIVFIAAAVLLMANLSALIDLLYHPDIPYFDEEHLVVGGITALLTAALFAILILYLTNLRISERRLRSLFDVSEDFINILDTRGVIIQTNQATVDKSGYRKRELIGRGINEFLTESSQKIYETHFPALLERGSCRVEIEIVFKDGRVRVMDCQATTMRDTEGNITSIMVVQRDITERKRMEEALRKSEKKFRDITSSLGEGIYVLNEHGCLTFMNPEAERLLGWTEAELVGRNVHDIIHRRKPDGTPASFEQCPMHAVSRTGKRYASRDETFIRKDGTVFPISALCSPIVENDAIIASVTAFRDITKRTEIEAERERLIIQLREALEKVKTLRGFIPICASCKKVRDDTGYWTQVEAYVRDHSLAEFSHSICPECAKKMYPEYYIEEDNT